MNGLDTIQHLSHQRSKDLRLELAEPLSGNTLPERLLNPGKHERDNLTETLT